MDNVFIERLWRSLKYECVYLNAFETGSEARQGIGHWIDLYNSERPHSAHAGATPEEVYTGLKKHSGGNKNCGVHLRPPRIRDGPRPVSGRRGTSAGTPRNRHSRTMNGTAPAVHGPPPPATLDARSQKPLRRD